MERVRTRAFLLALVFCLVGSFYAFALTQKVKNPPLTEEYLISLVPRKVGELTFIPSTQDPEVSYKMDEQTYKVLAPMGIVARTFAGKGKTFDAVVIASRDKDSFHDPRVCFSAQNWTLEKFDDDKVITKTRGTVPIMLITMSQEGRERKFAAFFYKVGDSFYGGTQAVKWAMLRAQLKGNAETDGVFYRFIPDHADATREELKQFIADYLDEANASSQGYF